MCKQHRAPPSSGLVPPIQMFSPLNCWPHSEAKKNRERKKTLKRKKGDVSRKCLNKPWSLGRRNFACDPARKGRREGFPSLFKTWGETLNLLTSPLTLYPHNILEILEIFGSQPISERAILNSIYMWPKASINFKRVTIPLMLECYLGPF